MKIILIILSNLISCLIMAQQGNSKLFGKVTNEKGLPVEYARVRIYSDSILKGGNRTDEHGQYSIFPIQNGNYVIDVYCPPYLRYKDTIQISSNMIQLDLQLKFEKDLKKAEVHRTITLPLIDPSNPGEKVIYRSDLMHFPGR